MDLGAAGRRSNGLELAGRLGLAICAVITRQAEPPLDAIHDRQPAIIHRADYAAWRDRSSRNAQAILDRARGHAFVVAPVNPAISNVRNKGPGAAVILNQ